MSLSQTKRGLNFLLFFQGSLLKYLVSCRQRWKGESNCFCVSSVVALVSFKVHRPPPPLPLLGLLLGVEQQRADAQLLQLLHQVPVLVHLQQDVAATHKLAVEVDLGDGGPVGVVLDPCKRAEGARVRVQIKLQHIKSEP